MFAPGRYEEAQDEFEQQLALFEDQEMPPPRAMAFRRLEARLQEQGSAGTP
jgi:hypothetical protein